MDFLYLVFNITMESECEFREYANAFLLYNLSLNVVKLLQRRYGVEIIYVEVPLPLTDSRQIDAAVEATLKQYESHIYTPIPSH